MTLSRAERLLLALASITVLYRYARDQWPVGLIVEPTEADA